MKLIDYFFPIKPTQQYISKLDIEIKVHLDMFSSPAAYILNFFLPFVFTFKLYLSNVIKIFFELDG